MPSIVSPQFLTISTDWLPPPAAQPSSLFASAPVPSFIKPKKINEGKTAYICAQCGSKDGEQACCMQFSVLVLKKDLVSLDGKTIRGVCAD